MKGKRAKQVKAKPPVEELQKEQSVVLLEEEGWENNLDSHTLEEIAIEWNESRTNFHVTTRDDESATMRFYGWYRKMRLRNDNVCYAIDMFVKHTDRHGKTQEFGLDSITYTEDPRSSIGSLNADIAAAMNKWLYTTLNGDLKTIEVLRNKADHPTIRIRRIATIDHIIMKLRECRDTAISCGGTRLIQLTGDTEGVAMNIVIDVTPQAIALKGVIPKLEGGMGGLMDRVIRTGGNSSTGGVVRNSPSPENIKALAEQLRHTTDKTEARKIRAAMRRMGHKGGARALSNGKAESK